MFIELNSFDSLNCKVGDIVECTDSPIRGRIGNRFAVGKRSKITDYEYIVLSKAALSHMSVYGDKFKKV